MKNHIALAVSKLFRYEDVYSKDPNDRGGETVYGVSRVNHPSLPLWKEVDKWDKKLPVPSTLFEAALLFYEDWWGAIKADIIYVDIPSLANEYFFASVNCGKSPATKMLQRALNMLNRNQLDYPDITEDGVFGAATSSSFSRLMQCKARPKEVSKRLLRKQFNIRLGGYYDDLYLKNPADERYIGWIDRVWAEG
jgi:lysozyme family protein